MSFVSSGAVQKRNYNLLFGNTGESDIPVPGFQLSRNFIAGSVTGGYTETFNRRVTTAGAGGNARTAAAFGARETGKWYYEFEVFNIGNYTILGWLRRASLQSLVQAAPNTGGANRYFYINVQVGQFASADAGVVALGTSGVGVYGFAVDMDTGNIWVSRNGVWSSGGDPALGTLPNGVQLLDKGLPAVSQGAGFGTCDCRILSSTAELVYPVPAGFAPWAV